LQLLTEDASLLTGGGTLHDVFRHRQIKVSTSSGKIKPTPLSDSTDRVTHAVCGSQKHTDILMTHDNAWEVSIHFYQICKFELENRYFQINLAEEVFLLL
jgi:hypothetical protein